MRIGAVLLALSIVVGCGDNERCIQHDGTYCEENITYWVNSCGDLEEVKEHCECGCNSNHDDCKSCGCVGNCTGKCCGDDGCGITCPNTCQPGYECNYNTCACEQKIDCTTNADCPQGYYCDLTVHQCKEIACTPQCTGKCCGSDGCGGVCPDECSETGQTCNAQTCTCEGTCEPECQGRECGRDGCGGTCQPGCGAGETCNESTGRCEPICTPSCGGKECGPDGCGGTCPPGCGTGETCENGTCVMPCGSHYDCDYQSICIDGSCELAYPEFGRRYRLTVRDIRVTMNYCVPLFDEYWDPEQGAIDYIGAPDLMVCFYEGLSEVPTGSDVIGGRFCTSEKRDTIMGTYNEGFETRLTENDRWLVLVYDKDSGWFEYEYVGGFIAEPFAVSWIKEGVVVYNGDGVNDCVVELVVDIDVVQ